MGIQLIKGDITNLEIDCIVNAANAQLMPGGGVCGAIHRAAGPELAEECRSIGRCSVGEAKITKGYNLPAKFVIHTVGPIWYGGHQGEEQYLFNCYKNTLFLAFEHTIQSIAFPNISTGIFNYPKQAAAEVAVKTVIVHQKSSQRLKKAIFCCFDEENYGIYYDLLKGTKK